MADTTPPPDPTSELSLDDLVNNLTFELGMVRNQLTLLGPVVAGMVPIPNGGGDADDSGAQAGDKPKITYPKTKDKSGTFPHPKDDGWMEIDPSKKKDDILVPEGGRFFLAFDENSFTVFCNTPRVFKLAELCPTLPKELRIPRSTLQPAQDELDDVVTPPIIKFTRKTAQCKYFFRLFGCFLIVICECAATYQSNFSRFGDMTRTQSLRTIYRCCS